VTRSRSWSLRLRSRQWRTAADLARRRVIAYVSGYQVWFFARWSILPESSHMCRSRLTWGMILSWHVLWFCLNIYCDCMILLGLLVLLTSYTPSFLHGKRRIWPTRAGKTSFDASLPQSCQWLHAFYSRFNCALTGWTCRGHTPELMPLSLPYLRSSAKHYCNTSVQRNNTTHTTTMH